MTDIDYLAEALKQITTELEKANDYLKEARERKKVNDIWTLEDERRLGELLGLNSAGVIVRTLLEEKNRRQLR